MSQEQKANDNENKNDDHTSSYKPVDAKSASARSLSRVNLQQPDTIVSKLCLVYAMLAEASPIIDHYSLKLDDKLSKECFPNIVYHSLHDSTSNIPSNCTIYVVLNGKDSKYKCDRVGTQAAAITTYNIVRHIKPDIIINAGTCGGIDIYKEDEIKSKKIPEIKIGQVYIGNISMYCDRNIPIEPWKDWGIGYYQLFGVNKLAKHLNLPLANVCSGNAFAYGEKEVEIWKLENSICKEMELAAIAEICLDFHTPLIALKGITDFVTHPSGSEQFLKHLAMTGKNVADTTIKTIDFVVGKKLGDLE